MERYTTPSLKEFEEKVLSAQSKALAREKWLYDTLLTEIGGSLTLIAKLAGALSLIDIIANLAERANTLSWCHPVLTNEESIEIIEGRHPVIEPLLKEHFISNDLIFDKQKHFL